MGREIQRNARARLHSQNAVGIIFCAALVAGRAESQSVEICPDRIQVAGSFQIPYCRNYPLDATQPLTKVTRAVIAIHGAERRATTTYEGVLAPAELAGQDATTLVIAPQFLNAADITPFPDDVLYWSGAFWRFGNLSVNGAPRMSSYAVLDAILAGVVDSGTFPNLNTVIVAGHSAGGQFVQRFSAGSPAEDHIYGKLGISMRYVVMNPGSWLYLNPARWDPDTSTFTSPDATACPGYDDYGYGLRAGLNEYMRAAGVETIRARFGQRQLAYILGDQDICRPGEVCVTPRGSPPPDGGCAANLQGEHRFGRGTLFYQYVQYFYLPDILSRHSLDIVPGVGHDGTAMFASAGSLQRIFDYKP